MQMRREQADLERKLWDERGAIVRKHEDKVKVACTKLVDGPVLSLHAYLTSCAMRSSSPQGVPRWGHERDRPHAV